MNEYDTGKMRAQLVSDGFIETHDPEEADVILLNTCSIREKAVDKMRSALGDYRAMKRNGANVTIGVAGCVAQQEGQRLLDQYRELDLVFGPDGVPHVRQLVEQAIQGKQPVLDTDFLDLDNYPFVADVDPADHGVGAFVTIQKGCDNKCTFCIVPSTRGVEISRPHEAILDEVRAFVDRGVQEITLIGQNVNSYGLKRTGEITFAQLLRKVAAVPGVKRIRYTTSHPRDMGDDVIEAHRDLEVLAPNLHLPVQSGSNRVLRRMKRYYKREHYLEIVRKLREARPGITLSTDIIVGFPGETDADFEETMSLLDEVGFVSAFSFKFSARPGTPALKLVDRDAVPPEVAQERLMRYQNRQRELSAEWMRSLEGTVQTVLVEGPSRHDEGVVCGRTGTFAMINFPGSTDLVGKWVDVRVTRGFMHSARGELVQPA
jgi:tRNA-2-methylthio-N6-dimethylallyladenosine synthase